MLRPRLILNISSSLTSPSPRLPEFTEASTIEPAASESGITEPETPKLELAVTGPATIADK
ncbi:hypothetical protein NW762_002660 [Fusarium torreyae]|uniref:Uncharacterized protein n=1 Tax=Fusarium torreyae TaxID=1237075 RepID=A0A9W8VMU2_9HYPO|nr:hypothetical protein NW762_002660 [Fusarium torreyae]